jgi:hypothetical protein
MFLLAGGNTPAIPAAAQPTAVFHESIYENAMFEYEITDLETESGADTANVALMGGAWQYDNSTPASLGGHFRPVPQTGDPDWDTPADWRNVVTLGVGYRLVVKIDTLNMLEEEATPGASARIFARNIDADYYLPQNPTLGFESVFHFQEGGLKAKILDTDGEVVMTTFAGEEFPAFFDPKILEIFFLTIQQYGNDTFYQYGAPDADDHWLPVNMHQGLGYWTVQYRGGTDFGFPSYYDMGWIAHDITTGIAHSFSIVNQQMLRWMSGQINATHYNDDPLIAFRIDYVGPYEEEPEPTKTTKEDDDSSGFELGVVLFSLASVAALVAYRKRK